MQRRAVARQALQESQQLYEDAMTQQQADRAQQDIATARAALAAADAEEVPGGGCTCGGIQYVHMQAPPPPELLPDFDVDEAMYFTDPQQLIDMFAQLEASNMFMLQANQASQDDAAAVCLRYEVCTTMQWYCCTVGAQVCRSAGCCHCGD